MARCVPPRVIPSGHPELSNRVAFQPMNDARILIVDDEPQIRRTLTASTSLPIAATSLEHGVNDFSCRGAMISLLEMDIVGRVGPATSKASSVGGP